MSINYPVFNISHSPVDEFLFPSLFRYNNLFFDNPSKERYYKHFHRMQYVDISGQVYEAVDLLEISSWLRKKLNLQRKYQIQFESVGRQIEFDEVKKIYINYLNGFKLSENRERYFELANDCKNFKELL